MDSIIENIKNKQIEVIKKTLIQKKEKKDTSSIK